MSESFAELFEESISKVVMSPGAVIVGEVIDMEGEFVIVNAGLKSEAEIPVEEFMDDKGELSINVGDTIEVAIEAFEDGTGQTRLSREKACRARAWDELEKSQ